MKYVFVNLLWAAVQGAWALHVDHNHLASSIAWGGVGFSIASALHIYWMLEANP